MAFSTVFPAAFSVAFSAAFPAAFSAFSGRLSRCTGYVAVLLATAMGVTGCSGGSTPEKSLAADASGECPTAPVSVVVSIDQWGDNVVALGGACADVTTILADSSVNPHDYEPAPAAAAAFTGAELVVINGGHYDAWAAKLAATSASHAPIIDALTVSGLVGDNHSASEIGSDNNGDQHADGINPHLWYDPVVVTAVADAVTEHLTELSPLAADYFRERRSEYADQMKPYYDIIETIKSQASGKTYAATEAVFDYMGTALGLVNRTPPGYQTAMSHETDPAPADMDAFLRLLNDEGVDVLIYDKQTEGSVPQQIRSTAEDAGIAVVEVTETVAPGAESFQSWQINQLTTLAHALGITI